MVENDLERPFGLDQLRSEELSKATSFPQQARPTITDDRSMLLVAYGALIVQPPTHGTKVVIDLLSGYLKQ